MCIFFNMPRRSRRLCKLMSTTRNSYNLYLQPGAGAHRRIQTPIFKIVINIICNNKQQYTQKSRKTLTFSLHMLNKLTVVWIALKFVLHAEAPDVCDFLHIWQVLVLVVHSSADGPLDEMNIWWRWRQPVSFCDRIWEVSRCAGMLYHSHKCQIPWLTPRP